MYHIYGLFKGGSSSLEDLYYVGITSNLKSRYKKHTRATGNNQLKKNYTNKYGCDIFVFWTTDCPEEASDRELFLIRWFGRICNKSGQLTNIINYKLDPEASRFLRDKSTKKLMSESAIKRSKNPEYARKQRDSQISRPIEEVHQILQAWQDYERWDLHEFLKPLGIKNSCFRWWVKKYRPDLVNEIESKKIRMYRKFLDSGMTKTEFASTYNVHRKTITVWQKKYAPLHRS